MITLEFLKEQLDAVPYTPFTIVLTSGQRYNVPTPEHADLPPPNEDGEFSDWVIVYNKNAVPRYLALEHIEAVEIGVPWK